MKISIDFFRCLSDDNQMGMTLIIIKFPAKEKKENEQTTEYNQVMNEIQSKNYENK